MRFGAYLAVPAILYASVCSAGSTNLSVNGYNLLAVGSVSGYNYFAVVGNNQQFLSRTAPNAKIDGLALVGGSAGNQPLSLGLLQEVLSKCLISGMTQMAANIVVLEARCAGSSSTTFLTYYLTNDAPAKVSQIVLASAPPVSTIIAPVEDK
ncbi:hypothetical protein [Novosphingobium colocasiae]|uniref:hypothetical protein n=1 Tax=Novosphingobium colocasiae TaxID=1256513 RepID=UPI0035B4944F